MGYRLSQGDRRAALAIALQDAIEFWLIVVSPDTAFRPIEPFTGARRLRDWSMGPRDATDRCVSPRVASECVSTAARSRLDAGA